MNPRQVFSLALALFALLVGTRTIADDKAVKDELKRHEGTWSMTSSIYDDHPASEDLLRLFKRIVKGDHEVWMRSGKRFGETKFVLDPSKEPKAIDVIPDDGLNRGKRVLGIYKLEGDKLTICMAASPDKPRPTEFKAGRGSGCFLRTFTRDRGTPNRSANTNQ